MKAHAPIAAVLALVLGASLLAQPTGTGVGAYSETLEPNGECVAAADPYTCCSGAGAGTCAIADLACSATASGDCTAASVPWACCTGADAGTCPSNDAQLRWDPAPANTLYRCDGASEAWVPHAAGGGVSLVLDLTDDNVDESSALAEIATSATSAIFSEPAADKLLIDLGVAWPTATALAADGADCAAGQWAAGVSASGGAQGCTADDDVPESGDFGAAVDLDADGAVSANAIGSAEIAAGSIAAVDLATDSVAADELDAPAVEAELEAVLDLAGLQEKAHASLTGTGADDHHAQAHALDGGDHTLAGATAGQVLQATGATTFELDWAQVRIHATDCTSLTDGESGEQCYEQDDDAVYVCEPTAGDCDTVAEWRPIGGGSAGGSDGEVQFNSSGAFAGDSGLTYVAGTDTLTVGIAATANAIALAGVASGSPPTITSTGTDTNVALTLATKGTGDVRLEDDLDFRGAYQVRRQGITVFQVDNGGGSELTWHPSSNNRIRWSTNGSRTQPVFSHGDTTGIGVYSGGVSIVIGGSNVAEAAASYLEVKGARLYGAAASPPQACPGTAPLGSRYFDTTGSEADCVCFSGGWTVAAGAGTCA